MRKYCCRLLINGVSCLLEMDGLPCTHGFNSTRWVGTPDPKAAEALAIQLFRGEGGLRARLRNTEDDPPTLYVEQVEAVANLQPAQVLSRFTLVIPLGRLLLSVPLAGYWSVGVVEYCAVHP